ncbi:hypothetical protein DH2020_045556 [Rehmannia glutinosa]|uniref:Uncharacterized protein n=1 Tax=Rehmannia glutinosa TaxID=99300 RepID=A0ABR0UEF9_REHGL
MALPNGVVESTSELLDAQAHVWNHIFNFINSMSLKCAIQLGIPDIIHKHNRPITLSQLVNALPINKLKSQCLDRLMRILTHSKFFVKVKISEDGNGNEDEDGYWIEERWNGLFNEGMASDARFVVSVLIKEYKQVFEGLKSMVDVGGGTGLVAKGIADAFPDMKCVVLELPHVVAGLEGDKNLSYVGGDMFESIPHADAVFLKWIFHDWTDEDSIKLLKRCKEAIISSDNNCRKVIIVETVVNDQKHDYAATETQLLFDMLMMIEVTGKERTEKEWAKLFFAAGFTNYKITPVLGLRSVIEVFP